MIEMNFMVKLIEVKDTSCGEARESLYENCTHVAGDMWLFEGDEDGLHPGVDFCVINERAIESYGDMSGKEIKQMVLMSYGLSEAHRKIVSSDARESKR